MIKNPFISKKNFKRRYNRCAICHDNEYSILDVHRWKKEGKEGGKYTCDNSIVLCAKCHRLVHSGLLKIIGIYKSTKGKVVFFIDNEGNEKFSQL